MKSWKIICIGAATAILTSAALATAGGMARPAEDPLLRPIAPAYANKRFLTPQPPARIFGNAYLVGFRGVSVALILTDAGLILIDGALPQGVREVEANIRSLGFRIGDVKLILSTEPHYDHAGGLAALVRDSGATVVVGEAAARVLRSGTPDPEDAQAGVLDPFPAVPRLRIIRDGERIGLGGVAVTAIATPGHTPGSMSWSWRSCEGRKCETMVFAASLNPASNDSYRFSDPAHAGTIAAFHRSFVKLRAIPCDILLSSHPEQSGGDVKFDRLMTHPAANPYIDPAACQAFADSFSAKLDKRLAEEAQTAPAATRP